MAQLHERIDVVEGSLQALFARVLREASGEPPQLRSVSIDYDHCQNALRMRARFHVEGQDDRFSECCLPRWDVPQHFLDRVQTGQVFYEADALWSRMFEDHYVRRVVHAAERQLRETSVTAADYAEGSERLGRLQDHLARFHSWSFAAQPVRIEPSLDAASVPRDAMQQAAAEMSRRMEDQMLSALGIDPSGQTNTEGESNALTIETIREAARALGRNPYHAEWRQAFREPEPSDGDLRWVRHTTYWGQRILRPYGVADYGSDLDVGTPEAQQRGLSLLKENLTPEQLAQYEKHKHFDVKGGESGKTYRIHHGRQMNIQEIRNGKPVGGLCFLPRGGLVAGDCMLAQKTALESFEGEALKIANRFAA